LTSSHALVESTSSSSAPGVGSAVRVKQRGNFVFQDQGENPCFSAGWRSKFLEETRVQVGNRRGCRCTIADRTNDGGCVLVESEIFHRIAVGEAACLPSRGVAALNYKECNSRRIAGAGIEQRAQNLPL
jgi:hypothetical protein